MFSDELGILLKSFTICRRNKFWEFWELLITFDWFNRYSQAYHWLRRRKSTRSTRFIRCIWFISAVLTHFIWLILRCYSLYCIYFSGAHGLCHAGFATSPLRGAQAAGEQENKNNDEWWMMSDEWGVMGEWKGSEWGVRGTNEVLTRNRRRQ